MCKCESCKKFQEELLDESGAICKWYMDNVICGELDSDDCDEYQEIEEDA